MRLLVLTVLFSHSFIGFCQDNEAEILAGNKAFREHINEEYADSLKSPLPEEERLEFKALPFFDININYHVIADFKRAKKAKTFKMKTTTDRKPVYEVYGTVTFTLNGEEFKLNVYQSHRLREMEEFKDDLFLPFTDLSNGNQSYGGGRFIDLKIPEGNTITIDFNQAYNPYCAYSHRYSCPIPPKENFLKTEVLAGVKAPH